MSKLSVFDRGLNDDKRGMCVFFCCAPPVMNRRPRPKQPAPLMSFGTLASFDDGLIVCLCVCACDQDWQRGVGRSSSRTDPT